MTDSSIRGFHAHLYYDPEELGKAQAVAGAAHERFGVPVGHWITDNGAEPSGRMGWFPRGMALREDSTALGRRLSPENVAQGLKWSHPIKNDLGNCKQWNG